jgi:hypothetical protein
MEVTFTETPKAKKATPQAPQAAPAAPAAAAEPQVIIPTQEELRERVLDTYTTMGWGDVPEHAVPQVKEVAPAGETPAAAPQAEPEAPPAPEEPQAEPEPELSPRELIEASADATARAVARALKPAEPQTTEPKRDDFQLEPDDQHDLQAIRYLEQGNPKKYAGLTDRYLAYVKAHYAYVDGWKEKNPDKEFDPQEEEHQQWYAANMPEIDERMLEQAHTDMAVEAKVQERLAPIEQERAQAKKERALEEAGPRIIDQMDRKIYSMVEQADPELAKLLKGENGVLLVRDAEALGKVDEANPIAKEILVDVVQNQLEPLLFELEKTTVPEYGYQLDPKKNAAHEAIAKFVAQKERDLAAMPAAQRILNGKRWMSLSEYAEAKNDIQEDKALSQSQKRAQVEALDRRVWTITADQVEDLMCDFYAKKAKSLIAKQEALAQRRFKVAPSNGAKPAAQPAAQPAARPAAAGGKPRSPSLGGQADVVSNTPGGGAGSKTFGQEATDTMFGR